MSVRPVLVSLALLLLAPASALASLGDEQRQGRDLVSQLRAGARSCAELSGDDFEHIGEYVMGRALGSTSVHHAMNDRMRGMMGEQAEEGMHEVIGERFTGCVGGTSAGGGVMGPGMMAGSGVNGGWSAVMSSGEYDWMMGSTWRKMDRQDWQRLRRQWLGTSATTSSGHGWSAWVIVAVALGSALLASLAILLVLRRPFRLRPAAGSG